MSAGVVEHHGSGAGGHGFVHGGQKDHGELQALCRVDGHDTHGVHSLCVDVGLGLVPGEALPQKFLTDLHWRETLCLHCLDHGDELSDIRLTLLLMEVFPSSRGCEHTFQHGCKPGTAGVRKQPALQYYINGVEPFFVHRAKPLKWRSVGSEEAR